jgi:peptide/nickel transport system permease protein
MVFDGQDYLTSAWWMSVIPATAIFVVVLAFSLFGDGLRDAFDPKLRRR